MNTAKPAVSFDEIINRDRQRKQHEALASEIFGKNRRTSEPGRNAKPKGPQTASLASRTSGIAKRSTSSTNIKPQRNNPFGSPKPPSRPSSAAAQTARTNRIASAINNTHQVNVVPTSQKLPGPGLTIRGTAGPFVVHASNFAPGTTAADIESALQGVATDSTGASGMASCRIMTNNPTVMAEMVFHEKHVAENVIATFNNQKADGRILHVFMHRSGPSAAVAAPLHKKKSEPALFVSDPVPSILTTKELVPEENGEAVRDDDDIDMMEDAQPGYSDLRQAADQDRLREKESRRAEPDVSDGRYGFNGGSHSERSQNATSDSQQTSPSQLREESRSTHTRPNDHNGSRREEGRDSGRRYDNPSSSSYQQRRGDSGYRRDDRYGSYSRGEQRPSHFDDGGAARGGGRGYGDRGYGRMYSDDMLRGGPRGARGGGRGGYR